MTAFEPLVDDLEPQLVLVAGDVNSTMACALVAAKAGFLVGNTMVDTLLATVERARAGSTLQRIGIKPGTYGLVTLHRPGNVDDPY